jgi:hypothetical protein
MIETLKPTVGMGATLCYISDRYPYTIVEIINEKTIVAQRDNATVIKGSEYDGNAEYEYTPDVTGYRKVFTLRKNGKWISKDEQMRYGTPLSIGERRRYYDPHM